MIRLIFAVLFAISSSVYALEPGELPGPTSSDGGPPPESAPLPPTSSDGGFDG